MIDLPLSIKRNPTAVLCLRSLPATVLELMEFTGMSRNAVRNAIKVLKAENLVYVSAYLVNVGCHAQVYSQGNKPDAKRVDKKVANKARHRRYYLKNAAKGELQPATQWRPIQQAA